ncbi:uncharacterized protein L203_100532 [Cryptococcus depauperatus CBS 7841]|uniref:RBR-type E3 ubiquitin transferase n=1 Tax=Cryptococcus depauperatus CBS 7841 TaxID=1295531 RepID=A0A1E3HUE9_9TREE|nr:hypothetical protein L203_06079 [Cryptococcus depauperatus CBS 7841]
MPEDESRYIENECVTLQNDELTVLESIYPGQTVIHPAQSSVTGKLLELALPVTLFRPLVVHLFTPGNNADNADPSAPLPAVTHLPPLTLRLHLPPLYPLKSPPHVIILKAPLAGYPYENESWLPEQLLKKLGCRPAEMWEEERQSVGEGQGVVWKWWEWITNGEFLSDEGLVNDTTLNLTKPSILSHSAFLAALKSYNAKQIYSDFEKSVFLCSICWENKKGLRCVQVPVCGCVFCTDCLSDCWTLAIAEGTLESVACPSAACVKRRVMDDPRDILKTEIDGNMIESVVGAEARWRWEELRERRIVEIDPSYCICPRPSCQAAVPPPESSSTPSTSATTSNTKILRLSDISLSLTSSQSSLATPTLPAASTEDRWVSYRLCPNCNFSFCLYCSSTWHGPHTVCALPQTSVLVQEYLSYPEGSAERLTMERRRGKAYIEKAVAKWREDEMNKQWLEQMTRACAGCGVRVEKSHGCNHMTCGRCNAHFCYRCGESIKPSDPYKHFNTPGKLCYQKLFDTDEHGRPVNIIGPVH